MADPRFFDNRGPFRLSKLCATAGIDCPAAAADALVFDVAGLEQAGSQHLSFFEGRDRKEFQNTKAGWCLVKSTPDIRPLPETTVLIVAPSFARAFAAIASTFYPEHETLLAHKHAVHPTARLGDGVQLGHGVVIGPGADIGENTGIGAGSVIGRGVTIGRNCLVGPSVSI